MAEDPTSNQFFRLSASGYAFVGLLDGSRTVSEAREIAVGRLGDAAPTEAEALRLLGMLHQSDLLAGEVPHDASSVFERRRRRRGREFRGRVASFLFVKIPLADPDGLLERWSALVSLVYTRAGFVVWTALIAAGLAALVSAWPEFRNQTAGVLAPGNVVLLGVVFVVIKLIHELGHGFANKAMARAERAPGASSRTSAGEVHELGLMLLVLLPVPYVDATSSWALRSRWRRALVAAAGMHAELAVAAVAAIVFANTDAGTTAHSLAYNAVFLAGVTTILFNANPLLRYDGYYILADVSDTPNLATRSREQLLDLMKRRLLGVKTPDRYADSFERPWLLAYAVAAAVYRVFIAVVIVWFVSGQFFVLGVLLAAGAAGLLIGKPVASAVHYLATSRELDRGRGRAVAVSVGLSVLAVSAVLAVPIPRAAAIPGVVSPATEEAIAAAVGGRIVSYAASGSVVERGDVLVLLDDPAIAAQVRTLGARLERERVLEGSALREGDEAAAAAYRERAAALLAALDEAERDAAALTVRAPMSGVWLTELDDDRLGGAVARGDGLGRVIDTAAVIEAVAAQTVGASLGGNAVGEVEIAAASRPGVRVRGVSLDVAAAASRVLPSPSLAYEAGGPIRAARGGGEDDGEVRAAEAFFAVRVGLEESDALVLGERVWVRIGLPGETVAERVTRLVRQALQRRNVLR